MKRLLLFSWMLLLMACETEITDFKTQNLSNAIVVYGEMSNMTGPYSVRLNYTSGYSPFDVTEFQGQAIQGADVRIVDESGAAISLKETAKGYYQTPSSFVGIIGKKYQLKIMTKAGQDIASDWQTLSSPIAAEGLDYTFVTAEKVENMRFDLAGYVSDKKQVENYYFIKRQDFIQFLTTCPEPPPPPAPVPACDCKCWQAPQNTQPILLTDFLVDGSKIKLPLGSIDYRDFTDWVVQLEVYTVDKATHTYWQRQEDQRKLGGGIFDKVPAQIIGNLKCLNNPDQQVLGYFMVAGKTKSRLTVDRYNGIPFETYNKLVNYVEFNNIRYKNYPLWDCRKAAWIPYNIGLKLPPN